MRKEALALLQVFVADRADSFMFQVILSCSFYRAVRAHSSLFQVTVVNHDRAVFLRWFFS